MMDLKKARTTDRLLFPLSGSEQRRGKIVLLLFTNSKSVAIASWQRNAPFLLPRNLWE